MGNPDARSKKRHSLKRRHESRFGYQARHVRQAKFQIAVKPITGRRSCGTVFSAKTLEINENTRFCRVFKLARNLQLVSLVETNHFR